MPSADSIRKYYIKKKPRLVLNETGQYLEPGT